MFKDFVEIRIAMTEQVHAQFQPHAVVAFIVGKLDIRYSFLEWFKGRILLRLVPAVVANFVQYLQELS